MDHGVRDELADQQSGAVDEVVGAPLLQLGAGELPCLGDGSRLSREVLVRTHGKNGH
jgi:hypothetical protein